MYNNDYEISKSIIIIISNWSYTYNNKLEENEVVDEKTLNFYCSQEMHTI